MKSITMKQLSRILKESIVDRPILSSDSFELVKASGIGTHETPWTGLKVISKGLAKKHAVEIKLNTGRDKWYIFDGTPIDFKYTDAYVSHGMRMKTDTLDETREYIAVLDEAVNFAERVNAYLKNGTVTEYEE